MTVPDMLSKPSKSIYCYLLCNAMMLCYEPARLLIAVLSRGWSSAKSVAAHMLHESSNDILVSCFVVLYDEGACLQQQCSPAERTATAADVLSESKLNAILGQALLNTAAMKLIFALHIQVLVRCNHLV